jgi:predicted Zn finger-like uncharacterized protein
MYTQCPECSSAFRVTAEVLRKAGGKVRCGGCHSAFNALLYLSETRPAAPNRPAEHGQAAVPELDPVADAAHATEEYETSGDAEVRDEPQSADTEDEQTWFYDTGSEWRIPGPDGNRDPNAIEVALFEGHPDSRVDEILDDAPTPVDEFLTETPADVDAAEVFADGGQGIALDVAEVFGNDADHPVPVSVPAAPEEELRFDDNTGLPEDFDLEATASPPSTPPEPLPEAAPEPPDPASLPSDLAFGDPGEWQELLQEVVTPATADGLSGDPADEPDELSAGFMGELDELRDLVASESGEFDDATVAADFDATEPTASAGRETPDQPPELVASESEEFDDATVVADFDATESAGSAGRETPDQPPDLDTQFDLQALSLGIDLKSSNDTDESGAQAGEDRAATAQAAADTQAGPTADETSVRSLALQDRDSGPAANERLSDVDVDIDFDAPQENVTEAPSGIAAAAPEDEEQVDIMLAEEPPEENAPATAVESGDSGVSIELSLEDDQVADSASEHAVELAIDLDEARELVRESGDESHEPEEQYVPPPTEEEQTVNMLIDEDLMRLAIPDEEGLTATIVFDTNAAPADDEPPAPTEESADPAAEPATAEVGFETIIMEGAFARTAEEQKRLAAEREAREKKVAKARQAEEQAARDRAARRKMRYGLAAGVVALALLLAGQFVHQSRAELATIPAIGGTIEPVYRAVGAPIVPEWDVKAWRLEVKGDSIGRRDPAGSGDPAGSDDPAARGPETDVLTIYSRLTNQAQRPQPYPLIAISLTNRYEEVIGSRVLEPAEYLAEPPGETGMVSEGDAFEPSIVIDGLSAEATGYRLNVCYPSAGDKLRCAIEDFR